MTATYLQVHNRLRKLSPASDYPCSGCGAPARDWAYQHTAIVELYSDDWSPYSEDVLADYAPMCVSCHRKLDAQHRDRVRAVREAAGSRDHLTYREVHLLLYKERGKASVQPCAECDAPATGWAYLHTAEVGVERWSDDGSPYSESIHDDYAAMCTSCHRKLDFANHLVGWTEYHAALMKLNPQYSERMREQGRRAAAFVAELRATDPEFAEVMRQSGARLAAELAEMRAVDPVLDARCREAVAQNLKDWHRLADRDPEVAERRRQIRQRNGDTHTQRLKDDPAYAAENRERMRRVAATLTNEERVERAKKSIALRRRCDECGKVGAPPHIGTHQKGSGHVGWTDLPTLDEVSELLAELL